MPAPTRRAESPWSRHAGWIAGALVTFGVLIFGAIVWFTYHP